MLWMLDAIHKSETLISYRRVKHDAPPKNSTFGYCQGFILGHSGVQELRVPLRFACW